MPVNLARSNRKTEFWRATTADSVGPGAYNTNHVTSFDAPRENFAPFLALNKRALSASTNHNPGPGCYVNGIENNTIQTSQAKGAEIRSSSFSTKVARFAPTTPGSTTYKASSSVNNPGPGAYCSQKSWNEKASIEKTREKYESAKHNDMVLQNHAHPPSIPTKKPGPNGYTGAKGDIPGPNNYHPESKITQKDKRATSFASSKTKRTLFEPTKRIENNLPSRDIPGPGHYDAETKKKLSLNAFGNSVTFLSKVPKCSNNTKENTTIAPGPGAYNVENSLNDSSISNNQTFLSKTKREGHWQNDSVTPFTKPFRYAVPGPGEYQNKKYGDDVKARIMMEEAHVPFTSSSERDCLKQVKKAAEPGPGQYIDISNPQNSSVAKGLLKFSNGGRLPGEMYGLTVGSFGGNVKKFNNGLFEVKEGPGPGHYAEDQKIKEEEEMLFSAYTFGNKAKTQTCFFKSKIDRFNPPGTAPKASQPQSRAPPNPLVIQPTKKPMPSVGDYDVKPPQWVKQTRANDHSLIGNKKVGFDSTSNRFHYNQIFFGTNLPFTPGPGQYEEQEADTSMNASLLHPRANSMPRNQLPKCTIVFNATEKKFKDGINSYAQKGSTNDSVGPGAYISTENSMIKKSYNMTMENSYLS